MDTNKRIIEIDGVKLEVDLRTAKVVDQYKIGDSVKLLKKNYSSYDIYPAVIIGFVDFKSKPCIELLYMRPNGELNFYVFHGTEEGQAPEAEIAPFNKYECLFQKEDILNKLDKKVNEAEESLRDAKQKKKAFIDNFAKVFEKSMS